MSFKDRAINLLEKQITRTAYILDVRPWPGNTFYEIDLHVPDADFEDLQGVQHIKCRVAALTFRDYTLARCDMANNTCTLYIDAAHDGAGSAWVKTLYKGGRITYMNIESHRYYSGSDARYLLLGDQSALGHILALQQLIEEGASIKGAIVMKEQIHCETFRYNYPDVPVQVLLQEGTSTNAIQQWLLHQSVTDATVYIAGNSYMVIELRKYLKGNTKVKQIKVQGFWR